MTAATPPKFEKTNHHYVPRFWIKRFQGANGVLWRLRNGTIAQTSAAKVMSEDWLYTDFDRYWRPGDGVEDQIVRVRKYRRTVVRKPSRHQFCTHNRAVGSALFLVRRDSVSAPDRREHSFERAKEMARGFADVSTHKDEARISRKYEGEIWRRCD